MDRSLLDRCTDTTAFRVLLALSGCAVLPVLGAGVLTTVVGGADLLSAPQSIEAEQAVFGLLSLGGVLGMIGYVRARIGVRAAARQSLAATLVLLAAGIATALAVTGLVATLVVDLLRYTRWPDALPGLVLGGLFAAANILWAMAGAGWIQRLLRRYAESTGRTFDSLPVVLLAVAIVLATAAVVATATL